MDITLIATAAMTFLTPYLLKSGEEIAKNIGKDVYDKLKILFIQEDVKLLEKANAITPTNQELSIIESKIKETLSNNERYQIQDLKELMNINSANEFAVGNVLITMNSIREEIKELYQEWKNAGIAVEGDYLIKISRQERKLKVLEKKFYDLLQ